MTSPMTPERAIRLAKAIQIKEDYERRHKWARFKPYEWQEELFEAGADNPQRMALCGNRVGKSYSAMYEVACHAMMQYPSWWKGKVYRKPPKILCSGVSGETMRDILQRELLGTLEGDQWDGTGFIPPEKIGKMLRSPITKDAVRDVKIRGPRGNATISFRAYSQGHMVIAGQEFDFVLIDEEPEHNSEEFYAQCVTRTMTSGRGKGGSTLLSMTPEHGMTKLVQQFLEDRRQGQFLINVGWDRAPHLTAKVRDQLLEALPPWQHRMRELGLPTFGEGLVYPVDEAQYVIDPMEIPDHWRRLVGIDFGFSHPFAAVWAAFNPEEDCIYVYDEYRERGETPPIHVANIRRKGKDIPVAYPHDGESREKGSGQSLISIYREAGLGKHFPFANPDGTRYVEPGILEIHNRMRTGGLRIFSTCATLLGEIRKYHRKDGKIVKRDDDLVDALRYCAQMVPRHGATGGNVRRIDRLSPRLGRY